MYISNISIKLSFIALILTLTTAHADQTHDRLNDESPPKISSNISSRAVVDLAFAPIKSMEDLQEISKNPSPLDYFSAAGRENFINGLAFNEKGVISINYSDISVELTPSEAYEVLSLFGLQSITPSIPGLASRYPNDKLVMDIQPQMMCKQDMSCVSRGTCGPDAHYCCTSNC